MRQRILKIIIFLLTAVAAQALAQNIIPADRITDWTPGVNVGVPGGIPNRTIIGSTVDAATYGTGGNTLQELDLNVKNTMIRHGNYDYLNHTIAWDGTISDHSLPNSYFRTSKPDYFGNLEWPPFDPASPPGAFDDSNLCNIPAGYRFVHGTDPQTSVPAYSNGFPTQTTLYQNYPNPLNPATTISYRLSASGFVKLSVYDVLGREVAILVHEEKTPGIYTTTWNATGFARGTYIAQLRTGIVVKTIKLFLIK